MPQNKQALFNEYSQHFYSELSKPELNFKAFNNALKGYYQLTSRYLSIADFSLSSNIKRYYLIDMFEQEIVLNDWVSHGMNTGAEYAKRFSNTPNSNTSSLGFFLAAEQYKGKHGLSLRMDGLEPGINCNARRRAIVIHGADYVSPSFIAKNGRLGRSFGCPAFQKNLMPGIVSKIKDGSCFYIYYPDARYEAASDCLSGDKYLDAFMREMFS